LDFRYVRSERVGGPDMIKPATTISVAPIIHRTVAPPRVELLRLGSVHAHAINPTTRFLRGNEFLAFHWRVRNHLAPLLVHPHVMLKRCDVEITHEDSVGRFFRL